MREESSDNHCQKCHHQRKIIAKVNAHSTRMLRVHGADAARQVEGVTLAERWRERHTANWTAWHALAQQAPSVAAGGSWEAVGAAQFQSQPSSRLSGVSASVRADHSS